LLLRKKLIKTEMDFFSHSLRFNIFITLIFLVHTFLVKKLVYKNYKAEHILFNIFKINFHN
jgi:hypothetical protein